MRLLRRLMSCLLLLLARCAASTLPGFDRCATIRKKRIIDTFPDVACCKRSDLLLYNFPDRHVGGLVPLDERWIQNTDSTRSTPDFKVSPISKCWRSLQSAIVL
jgi:hypothetical protein